MKVIKKESSLGFVFCLSFYFIEPRKKNCGKFPFVDIK